MLRLLVVGLVAVLGVTGLMLLLSVTAGGFVFALGCFTAALALWLLHHLDPSAGRIAEIAVLVVAQGIATCVRFLTLHAMMSRPAPLR